jgi:hypothetical protein
MGQTVKRGDSQLADIQFRLSGITRPLGLLSPPNFAIRFHLQR